MRYPIRQKTASFPELAFRLLTDPTCRLTLLIILAYTTAALGLGVTFLGGVRNPNSDFATLGIVLLFVSFASLFYVSVTVLNLEHAD